MNNFKQISIRFSTYLFIWLFYLFYVSNYYPLGSGWLDWHSQRIFNFSEFLKFNGYFKTLGFSIWSKCDSCSLSYENWKDQIYISTNLINNFHYILINQFFGIEGIKVYGSSLTKSIIFLTGVIFSEIFFNLNKNKKNYYFTSVLSTILFVFFIVNPWTYKMILAPWNLIYFILFFSVSIFFLIKNKKKLSLITIFLSAFFEYQFALGLGLYYFLMYIFLKKEKKKYKERYINLQIIKKYIFAFILPVIIFLFLKILFTINFKESVGSNIFDRIGVTSNNIHSGGILGSLQFLAGNRVTVCINKDSILPLKDINTNNKRIKIYNCSLSLLSMTVLSVIAFIINFLNINKNKFVKLYILPLFFLLISSIFILQQSMSVHLMGYSYLFSFIFAYGLIELINILYNFFKDQFVKIIMILPLIAGIIIICIRVSLLTGING